MVGLAHFDFANRALVLHAFKRVSHFFGLDGSGFLHCGRQHAQRIPVGSEDEVFAVLGFVGQVGFFQLRRGRVVAPVPDHAHFFCAPRTHFCRRAGVVGVHGEEVDVQAALFGRLEKQGQVAAPVGGDHRVGARGLDLGHVGRKVAHLGNRDHVVAHDGHVRALAAQVQARSLGHLLAVGVVLVKEVDLFHVRALDQIGGQGLDLHFARWIEAEMPKVATLVGEQRVHGRVVHEHHGFFGLALGELGNRVAERQRHARAAALGDVVNALVHRRLERDHALLGRTLAVKGHDLKRGLFALGLGVELQRHFAQLAQRALAGLGKRPRHHLNKADLDDFGLGRQSAKGD